MISISFWNKKLSFFRYLWTHGITPRKNDVITSSTGGLTLQARGVRTSFTFRKIKSTPCECAFKSCCDSQTNDSSIITENSADDIEKNHVFQVYDDIASHFSDTRHKPWPEVLKFVQSLPVGSILVDIGCGNGKYIGHSPFVLNVSLFINVTVESIWPHFIFLFYVLFL